jgi:hypothetical protein
MRILVVLLLGLCVAAPAIAGPASERVFSREALAKLAQDQQLVYSHVREGAASQDLQPISNGEIRIELRTAANGASEAFVQMGDVGQLRPVSSWPASSGNPLVPIFLESTLRSMSRATGGGEFYIRNRIKEALGSGGTIEDVELQIGDRKISAQRIVFEPFIKDKNRDRMGAFADMKLEFLVSEDLPGDVVSFRAETDGATYSEEIAFSRIEEGG